MAQHDIVDSWPVSQPHRSTTLLGAGLTRDQVVAWDCLGSLTANVRSDGVACDYYASQMQSGYAQGMRRHKSALHELSNKAEEAFRVGCPRPAGIGDQAWALHHQLFSICNRCHTGANQKTQINWGCLLCTQPHCRARSMQCLVGIADGLTG